VAGSLERMPRTRTLAYSRVPQTSDRRLVERAADGDDAAFRELLARYRSTVYATAYAVVPDPEQVEAIVADAFNEARRTALEFLDSLGSVSGWLTHLTRLCIAARLPRLS
jgi:RNA polymerase sigma-70 factor, ECF subfamily